MTKNTVRSQSCFGVLTTGKQLPTFRRIIFYILHFPCSNILPDVFIFIRHVSASAFGHLQGTNKFLDHCSVPISIYMSLVPEGQTGEACGRFKSCTFVCLPKGQRTFRNFYFYYLYSALWACLGRNQSPARRPIWLQYAASWASSQGQFAIAFPPTLNYSRKNLFNDFVNWVGIE